MRGLLSDPGSDLNAGCCHVKCVCTGRLNTHWSPSALWWMRWGWWSWADFWAFHLLLCHIASVFLHHVSNLFLSSTLIFSVRSDEGHMGCLLQRVTLVEGSGDAVLPVTSHLTDLTSVQNNMGLEAQAAQYVVASLKPLIRWKEDRFSGLVWYFDCGWNASLCLMPFLLMGLCLTLGGGGPLHP